MATKTVQVVPLVDIESEAFAQQYEHGIGWAMYGEGRSQSPQPVGFLVKELQKHATRGSFTSYDAARLGFLVGVYHGEVLSPHTGLLRPGVTTLARLDHASAARGYAVAREFVFVDAEPHERRWTETTFLADLRETVEELTSYNDTDETWYYTLGGVLGSLSTQLFPMTKEEETNFKAQYPRWVPAMRQETMKVVLALCR